MSGNNCLVREKFQIEMTTQEKIELLESRITALEIENASLKSLLKNQMIFGNKMTEIVSEMDELLEKKRLEIESLTNQLIAKPSIENLDDFSIDLSTSTTQVGYMERQKLIKIEKDRLDKEFEKTTDGKFKCPYKEICNHVTRYRWNLKDHIRLHTGEKPYVCDICGRGFVHQTACRRHMLTHPEMKGVQCDYCRIRVLESEIENHQAQCRTRKRRKKNQGK